VVAQLHAFHLAGDVLEIEQIPVLWFQMREIVLNPINNTYKLFCSYREHQRGLLGTGEIWKARRIVPSTGVD